MTTTRLLTQEKKMEVIPIGKTLTKAEWAKFTKHLSNKEKQDCERKQNGTVAFIGEGGLEPLKCFQAKFNSRFHFRMICANESWAKDGLQLAADKGIAIQELHYKNDLHAMRMLNDQNAILKLM